MDAGGLPSAIVARHPAAHKALLRVIHESGAQAGPVLHGPIKIKLTASFGKPMFMTMTTPGGNPAKTTRAFLTLPGSLKRRHPLIQRVITMPGKTL